MISVIEGSSGESTPVTIYELAQPLCRVLLTHLDQIATQEKLLKQLQAKLMHSLTKAGSDLVFWCHLCFTVYLP